MDIDKINKTIEDTRQFYHSNQEDFSKTRQNPWPGWKILSEMILNEFAQKEQIKILDLGCGNGRFYSFLNQNIGDKKILEYSGMDTNDYMLVEALLKYPDASFLNFDIFSNIENIKPEYDIVAAFGITHHLPGKDFRKNWFKKAGDLVTKGGMLVLTFWNLAQDERFEKTEPAEDMEENDYYYGWSGTGTKRYVHSYTQKEISEIINLYDKIGFEILKQYSSDGRSGCMNDYLVFKKVN